VKVDFTLSPGSIDQTIEVKSEAVLLQTEEGEVKNPIYRSQVENESLKERGLAGKPFQSDQGGCYVWAT
jgi:hypothetical protein